MLYKKIAVAAVLGLTNVTVQVSHAAPEPSLSEFKQKFNYNNPTSTTPLHMAVVLNKVDWVMELHPRGAENPHCA